MKVLERFTIKGRGDAVVIDALPEDLFVGMHVENEYADWVVTGILKSSGSTCNCSISVKSCTIFCGNFFGSVNCTVDGSSGSAIGAPI